MTPKLKRKWALVTGATSGMGLEYSRQLAALGCNILMVSNQQAALESLPPQLHRLLKKRLPQLHNEASSFPLLLLNKP